MGYPVSTQELTYIIFCLYDELVVDHNEQIMGGILTANGLVISLNLIVIYLKLSNAYN